MPLSKNQFFFLDWDLHVPCGQILDLIQGDDVIDIYTQEIGKCQATYSYTLPIDGISPTFSSFRLRLLYRKPNCSTILPNIFFSIRIRRRSQQRVIYTSDFVLSPHQYATRQVQVIPIYRAWYWEDCFKV